MPQEPISRTSGDTSTCFKYLKKPGSPLNEIADIKALLDGYEDELSGEAAEAFDVLYDAVADALAKETDDE